MKRDELIEFIKTSDAANKILAERSLHTFVQLAWPHARTAGPFVDNWHVKLICDHLQAVFEGKVRNLLVNIPPGLGKSIICNVFFPAWAWTRKPKYRLLMATYGEELTLRDSDDCRALIKSSWYQRLWGHVVKIREGGDNKRKFENTAGGWRLSTSVGGRGTGYHPSVILCLAPGTLLQTDRGLLPIEQIVSERTQTRVLSFNHELGTHEFRDVLEFEETPGRPCVTLTTSSGKALTCTTDHPVFVVGKGYIEAATVAVGDKVLTCDFPLPAVRCGVQVEAVPEEEVLQLRMQCGGEGPEHADLRHVRQGVLAGTGACGADREERQILLAQMPRRSDERGEAPPVSRRPQVQLQEMRQGRDVSDVPQQGGFLLERMQTYVRSAEAESDCGLPHSRQADAADEAGSVEVQEAVLASLPGQGNVPPNGREAESAMGRRDVLAEVPRLVFQDQEAHPGTGQSPLHVVREGQGGVGQESGRASHRLRQDEQPAAQFDNALPLVPRADARLLAKPLEVDVEVVAKSSPGIFHGRVYNVRVEGNRNYFANGILTHNCDDLHKADHASSPAELQAAIDFWSGTLGSRGILVDCSRVLIGQRICRGDVSAHAISQGTFMHVCLPMEFEPGLMAKTPFGCDPRTQPGELLFPQLATQEKVDALKFMLGWKASAQLQQNPTSPEGAIYDAKHFRRVRLAGDQEWGRGLPRGMFELLDIEGNVVARFSPAECFWFQAIDYASKTGTMNDWTVVGTFAITPGGDLVVFHIHRERVKVPDQFKLAMAMRQQFPFVSVQAVEDAAGGISVIQEGVDKGIDFHVLKATRDKVDRAGPISRYYAQGKVYHREAEPWLPDFETELLQFPGGVHDDQADVAAWAGQYMLERSLARAGVYAPDDVKALPDVRAKVLSLVEKMRGAEAG